MAAKKKASKKPAKKKSARKPSAAFMKPMQVSAALGAVIEVCPRRPGVVGGPRLPRAAHGLTAPLTSRGRQQLRRKRSSTRTPNLRPSTGTRSSTPWNMAAKSKSAGSSNGRKP